MLMIKNLHKEVACPNGEKLTILDVAEFRVEQGEQVLLTGSSGSGKTTLLHIISGLVTPTSGQMRYGTVRLDALSPIERDQWRAKNVGYIFQKFNLLNALTVLENVLIAGVFAGRQVGSALRAEAEGLLKAVGLGNKSALKPAKLSMGEQQRVAIARAILNKPKLILADEPTASLDQANVRIVLDLLKAWGKENNSMLLLSTHDPSIIAEFGRRYDLRTGQVDA